MALSKKRKAANAKVDPDKLYDVASAMALVKEVNTANFDCSVDLHIRLGVDPRKADQAIRGTVTLPNGTGKTKKVLVLCTPDKEEEAKAAAEAAKKLAEENAGNSVVKLQEAVQWAEKYPVHTVSIMQNIISLLPERGFIQSFEYSNMDSVLVTIQYDAARDAAFYLSSLKQAEWVEKAELLNVVALEVQEDTEENNSSDEMTLPRYSAGYKIVYRPELFKSAAIKGGDGS